MATKDDLKNQIEELNEKIVTLETAAEDHADLMVTLEAQLQEAIAAPAVKVKPKPEATTKMYWTGRVNTSIGAEPRAFGLELKKDDEGEWYADVPNSRIDGETKRNVEKDVSVFSLTSPSEIVPEDESEQDPDEE